MFESLTHNEEPFLRRPLVRVFTHVLIGTVFIGIVKLAERFSISHETQMKVLLYLMYFLAAEAIVYFGGKLRETTKSLEATRDQIAAQNTSANTELVRIATEDIEEKIFRKLVSTNAIIPDRTQKVSITARVLEDFHDKDDYEDDSIVKENTESIDLIRVLAYQNLLLTPKYLEYFYYRQQSVSKATRIIVLDRDPINNAICQATLTYLFISARNGYETYILPERRFKQLTQESSFSKTNLKIIKGNPFMLKIANGDSVTYKGHYTDYRENIEYNGTKKPIGGNAPWELLERFKRNSASIRAETTGFAEYIQTRIATLLSTPIV